MRAEILQTRARLDFLSGGVFAIKKIKLRSLLEEAIEKTKDIDHEKAEREIEEESNQLAKKRFDI
jgi:F0F1-type ATP synthase epsilon subunit